MTTPAPPRDRAGRLTAGVGLKPAHYRAFLSSNADGLWAEAHPENYMEPGGPRLKWLDAVRRARPLSLHGVALSLGGADRPDRGHLQALKTLTQRYEPILISEHLAWCAHGGVYFGDLLPLPYTEAHLDRFCAHVDETQSALNRRILIENPSLYIRLNSDMSEAEFLSEAVRRTGCGLLLDINNVYVTASNLQQDGLAFIRSLPAHAVEEYHLAGHAEDPAMGRSLLIDSHGADIAEPVWRLFEAALEIVGPRPTIIERDANIPPFSALMRERDRAAALLTGAPGAHAPRIPESAHA